MTTPIRPPSPRALENSAGIHRSPSFRVPVAFSPLDEDFSDAALDLIIEQAKEDLGTTRKWTLYYEAMRRDEYLQRVREKQFGHVFRNEVRMPKKP